MEKLIKNNKYKPIEVGDKFGRLTVIKFDYKSKWKQSYYICKCKCGNIVSVRGAHLKNGNTNSCGCLRKECLLKNREKKEYKTIENKHQTIGDKIKCYTYSGKAFYISKESGWVLKDYCWNVNKDGYVTTKSKKTGKTIRIHRLLLKGMIEKGKEVDHIDGDRTNNCLDNLRMATKAQNQWNIIREENYGIREHGKNSYQIKIGYKGKRYYLGTCHTIQEARQVRDDWENCHERKEYFRQEKKEQ